MTIEQASSVQPRACARCGQEFTPRLDTTTTCFGCWQDQDHADKDVFYRPIVDALAARGVRAYVEPELGGGCHALRVPFEFRPVPGTSRSETPRSAMLTLDGDTWLLVYYDDLAHDQPEDYDEEGTYQAILPVPEKDLPGEWPAPPNTAEAERVAAWMEGLVRDWGWHRQQPDK